MVAHDLAGPRPAALDYIVRSGGIFRDMTIHDFDMARWLLGEEVEKVQASASVLVDPEIGKRGDFDSANVILTTASGRQCTHHQLAPRGLRLRPADRGAGIEGHRLGGEPCARPTSRSAAATGISDRRLLELLHDPLHRRLRQRDRRLRRGRWRRATQPPTTGDDGLMALALADGRGQLGRRGANGPGGGGPR